MSITCSNILKFIDKGWATQSYEGQDPARDSDLTGKQLTPGFVKEYLLGWKTWLDHGSDRTELPTPASKHSKIGGYSLINFIFLKYFACTAACYFLEYFIVLFSAFKHF